MSSTSTCIFGPVTETTYCLLDLIQLYFTFNDSSSTMYLFIYSFKLMFYSFFLSSIYIAMEAHIYMNVFTILPENNHIKLN